MSGTDTNNIKLSWIKFNPFRSFPNKFRSNSAQWGTSGNKWVCECLMGFSEKSFIYMNRPCKNFVCSVIVGKVFSGGCRKLLKLNAVSVKWRWKLVRTPEVLEFTFKVIMPGFPVEWVKEKLNYAMKLLPLHFHVLLSDRVDGKKWNKIFECIIS